MYEVHLVMDICEWSIRHFGGSGECVAGGLPDSSAELRVSVASVMGREAKPVRK